MKLPNGYGSVTKMSGSRRKPYIVRKTLGWVYDEAADRMRQNTVIIGYAKTKKEGLQMLAEYNQHPYDVDRTKTTFAALWEEFVDHKFKDDRKSHTFRTYQSAFHNCSALHDRKFVELRQPDLQKVIDTNGKAKSTNQMIKTLYNQMYKYAMMHDIVTTDYARFVSVRGEDGDSGTPFTMEQLHSFWEDADNPDTQIVLMMIYSSFRIGELCVADIDIENGMLNGGEKTIASRKRRAPIHEATLEFWKKFDQASFDPDKWRSSRFYRLTDRLGCFYDLEGRKHTPHDCRHTFSWLADKYKMDETCKHLLMGHKLKGDTEQTVYRHRTTDELRDALRLIPAPI